MSVFKCKMCGGTLEVNENQTTAVCEYCGANQTLPKIWDEKRANLYDRANHFRRKNEFDKAMSIYEQILGEDMTDSEAYWSLVLCRYGIEYVEDPLSHKRKPTVHRAQYTSILTDGDYKQALLNADGCQKKLYETEAKAIFEIQKKILAISEKEKPFDVFICYKETDADGNRTVESVIASDIYYNLTQEGYKVFYSAVTLEKKVGEEYEPYIFAALNSAKIMLVIGTSCEHFNAVWVKNEWSRFLQLAKTDEKRLLIPCYRNMNPYDLPEEFAHLQAQDMSKIGFINDLLDVIKNLTNKRETNDVSYENYPSAVVASDTSAPLLRRAFLCLEDKNFIKADVLVEQVLNQDPENAEAYLAKVMIAHKICKKSEIANANINLYKNMFFNKALRFAKEDLNLQLLEMRNSSMYIKACELMQTDSFDKYEEALEMFAELDGYKDSTERKKTCQDRFDDLSYAKAKQLKDEAFLLKSVEKAQEASELFGKIISVEDSETLRNECIELKNSLIYSRALDMKKKALESKDVENIDKMFKDAINLFSALDNYNDSIHQKEECNLIRNEMLYSIASNSTNMSYALQIYQRINSYKDSSEKIDNINRKFKIETELSNIKGQLAFAEGNKQQVRMKVREMKKYYLKKRNKIITFCIAYVYLLVSLFLVFFALFTGEDELVLTALLLGVIPGSIFSLFKGISLRVREKGKGYIGSFLLFLIIPIFPALSAIFSAIKNLKDVPYAKNKTTLNKELSDATNAVLDLQKRRDGLLHDLSL